MVIAAPKIAPSTRRPTLRARRQEARRAARTRLAQRIARPAPSGHDPLLHEQRSLSRWLGIGAALVVGSIVAHACALAALGALGEVLARTHHPTLPSGPIEVAMLEPPPPPPPPPPVEPATERTVRHVVAPAPEKAAKPEPPPDPIGPKPQPEDAPPPTRRIIGLSLESTVVGGGGPAFAVGSSRMGSTDKVAHDRQAVAPPPNRVASRIPTAAVAFTPPVRRASVRPVYPPGLHAQGIEGEVVLSVTVDANGAVTRVEVVRPAPEPEMNNAAVAAARTERYEPACRDGVPVEHIITFTVRFRLTD